MDKILSRLATPTVGFHYGGIEDPWNKLEPAHAVIIPVPYDGTTSYRPGTRFGPQALIAASRNMELYDEQLGAFYTNGLHTLPELEPVVDAEEMVRRVEEVAEWVIDQEKTPIMVGGEHSLTTGMVRALHRRHANLTVLQLDAHGDLRFEYQGTPFSHASVMRRVREICPAVQAGIRSISEEEADLIKKEDLDVYSMRNVREMAGEYSEILDHLGDEVYITVDLDVFDPGECPGVGTPEPGGLSWFQMSELIEQLAGNHKIVGFDITELMPIAGDVRSEFLAARLLYRMWGWTLVSQGKHPPPKTARPL